MTNTNTICEGCTAGLPIRSCYFTGEILHRGPQFTFACRSPKMTTKLTSDTITDDQIEALRVEALAAGDAKMAATCTAALGIDDAGYPVAVAPSGQRTMRGMCADAINAARAQDDTDAAS